MPLAAIDCRERDFYFGLKRRHV